MSERVDVCVWVPYVGCSLCVQIPKDTIGLKVIYSKMMVGWMELKIKQAGNRIFHHSDAKILQIKQWMLRPHRP